MRFDAEKVTEAAAFLLDLRGGRMHYIKLGVQSRHLMVHTFLVDRKSHYWTGFTSKRHNDRGDPSSDTA